MIPPRDQLLIGLLAQQDALWLPQRSRAGHTGANIYEGRLDFRQAGVPLVAGGGESYRQAAGRLRDALAREGVIRVTHPRRVRGAYARLSEAAEVGLRRRLGLAGSEDDAWLSMQELARHSVRPATQMEHVWICECALIGDGFAAGSREEAAEAAVVELLMLWGLSRELVEGRATRSGLAYYRLTDAGWAWLDAGVAPPEDDDLPIEQLDRPARVYYQERLLAALERFQTATPQHPNELGELPLPASMVGVPLPTAPASMGG